SRLFRELGQEARKALDGHRLSKSDPQVMALLFAGGPTVQAALAAEVASGRARTVDDAKDSLLRVFLEGPPLEAIGRLLLRLDAAARAELQALLAQTAPERDGC